MKRMWSKNELISIINNAITNEEIKLYEDIDLTSSFYFNEIVGITFEKGFCSLRKTKENELYIVVNFYAENTTESAINLGNLLSADFALPSEIAEKIIDVNGKSVHDTLSSFAGITGISGYTDQGSATAGFYSSAPVSVLNLLESDKMRFQYRSLGSISAGAKWNFTFRLFLTL